MVELIPDSYVTRLNLPKIFGRAAPLQVDLGCGNGSFLCALAERMPEKNFLGVERLIGRVRSACRKAARIDNMRVIRVETAYAVRYLLPEQSVQVFHLLFPDPWPKRRHKRRRVMTSEFLRSVHCALAPQGLLRIATDQLDYFDQMQRLARAEPSIDRRPAHPQPLGELSEVEPLAGEVLRRRRLQDVIRRCGGRTAPPIVSRRAHLCHL